MNIDEAAREVESYLVEEGFKMSQLKKVQQKLQPKVEETAPAPVVEAAKRQIIEKTPLKTLTHSVSATTPTSRTEKERVERAKLAARGLLK